MTAVNNHNDNHPFWWYLFGTKRSYSTKEMYKTIWRSIDSETKNETFCAVLKHINKLQTTAEVDKWTVSFLTDSGNRFFKGR